MHILISSTERPVRITLLRKDGTRQTVAIGAHEDTINVFSEAPTEQIIPEIVLVTPRIAKICGHYNAES